MLECVGLTVSQKKDTFAGGNTENILAQRFLAKQKTRAEGTLVTKQQGIWDCCKRPSQSLGGSALRKIGSFSLRITLE